MIIEAVRLVITLAMTAAGFLVGRAIPDWFESASVDPDGAIVVSRPGGPEVLELEERPIPDAVEGEVLIRSCGCVNCARERSPDRVVVGRLPGQLGLRLVFEVGVAVPLEFRSDREPERVVDELAENVDPKDRLATLEADLRRMGPINPLAAAEYAELAAAVDELESQLSDLNDSRSELKKVISALDEQMGPATRKRSLRSRAADPTRKGPRSRCTEARS